MQDFNSKISLPREGSIDIILKMEEHSQARFIVETLAKAGFVAYYAGGWVRDFLLQHPSDDIDIATNAPPETIQAIFPHTVPIGIAFGIILVIIDDHQYEVATFRQDLDYKDGRRPSRIEFATAAEDAKRRDFTINGMFYDPLKQEVLDFVKGKQDLEKKIIRAIGNPHERIKEDRLRMIRAVRLSCRFQFAIEEQTQNAIRAHANELFPAVAIERICQEFEKGRLFGKLHQMLIQLHEFHLLAAVFPSLKNESVETIKNRLRVLENYPREAPLIAFLLPLFPNTSLSEQLDLCKKLKLSNLEQQFVSFLFSTWELIRAEKKRPIRRIEWAYFYSNRLSSLTLQILSVHLGDPLFLKEHEERANSLKSAIDRIHRRDPVVTSQDLIREGVPPGKTMGQLLSVAEQIAIDEEIANPSLIIARLKQLDIWPI